MIALALAVSLAAPPPALALAARDAGAAVRIAPQALADCDAARTLGASAADRFEDSWTWRLRGFVLPGIGIAWAAGSDPEPRGMAALAQVENAAVGCFLDAYRERARTLRTWWTAQGSVALVIAAVPIALGY